MLKLILYSVLLPSRGIRCINSHMDDIIVILLLLCGGVLGIVGKAGNQRERKREKQRKKHTSTRYATYDVFRVLHTCRALQLFRLYTAADGRYGEHSGGIQLRAKCFISTLSYGLEFRPSGTKRVNQETFFKLSVCHGFLVDISHKLSQ